MNSRSSSCCYVNYKQGGLVAMVNTAMRLFVSWLGCVYTVQLLDWIQAIQFTQHWSITRQPSHMLGFAEYLVSYLNQMPTQGGAMFMMQFSNKSCL